jgi:antitoxin component YwqK of YwqJK toxin-antitoxin module
MRINIDDSNLEYVGIDAGGGNMWNYNGTPFTGIIEEFYDNGNLVGEREFKDGYTNGIQTIYYENGQIKEEYFLRYNRNYNTYKYWNENGVLLMHVVFDDHGNEINRILG